VTTAVHGVFVGEDGVETVVVVADEISAEGNETVGAEAAAQSGMLVVNLLCQLRTRNIYRRTYTSVDNGNLDTVSSNALSPQLINLSHNMRGESASIVSTTLLQRSLHSRRGSPLHTRSGNAVDLDGPHVLHNGKRSHLGSQVLCRLDIVKLDRHALKEVIVEFNTCGGLAICLFVELCSILYLLENKPNKDSVMLTWFSSNSKMYAPGI
jgi:hypothetical protein